MDGAEKMKQGSFYIIRQEWVEALGGGSKLLVYAYIATMCENYGECSASIPTIAKATGNKERNVYNCLQELMKAGYLLCEQQVGKPNRYTPAKFAPLQNLHPCKICTPTPAKNAGVPLQNLHPLYINQNIKQKGKTNSARARAYTPDLSFVADELKEAFADWLAYKAERRQSYKTQRTTEACYNHLLKLAENDTEAAKEIIKQSIANNWSGLFPLKTTKQHGTDRQRNSGKFTDPNEATAAILAGINAAYTERGFTASPK